MYLNLRVKVFVGAQWEEDFTALMSMRMYARNGSFRRGLLGAL